MRKMKIDRRKHKNKEKGIEVKNRHSMQQRLRGRPPLPFCETVPGRIHSKLGSLNSIIWRLRFGGENRRELLQSAGVNLGAISRQRDSQIIKSIFEHAGKRSRLSSHHPQWRLARFLRGLTDSRTSKINSSLDGW